METIGACLERKHREMRLIGACPASPPVPSPPRSIEEAVAQKFRLAAALEAEHAAARWSLTETRRAAADACIGPCRARRGYRCADLTVRGPTPCPAVADGFADTIHRTSGMAAISAFFMALGRATDGADILVPPGCCQ